MRDFLGEELSGVVSTVTSFGLFVTLDAMYVEGLVHITELGGDYFKFDETRQELRGERTGVRFTLGSRVQVQVSRVDLDGRKIDFRLVRAGDGGDLQMAGSGKKGTVKASTKQALGRRLQSGDEEAISAADLAEEQTWSAQSSKRVAIRDNSRSNKGTVSVVPSAPRGGRSKPADSSKSKRRK